MNMERQPTRLSNWTFTWKTSQFNIERFKVTNRTSSRATSRKESCQYIKHLHHDRHTDRETDRRTSAFIRQTENLPASQTRAEKYRHATPKVHTRILLYYCYARDPYPSASWPSGISGRPVRERIPPLRALLRSL